MYIWTNTNPVRDCSFEAGVVIHEYTHGLSEDARFLSRLADLVLFGLFPTR
jgi:hypothetical protein